MTEENEPDLVGGPVEETVGQTVEETVEETVGETVEEPDLDVEELEALQRELAAP